MSRAPLEIVREWLPIVAVMGLLVSNALLLRRAEAARDLAMAMEPGYRRAQLHDVLIGTHIDLSALGLRTSVEPGHEGRFVLLWIVDLDRCVGCFDSVTDWVGLEAATDHSLYMLLLGDPTPDVEARLRVLERTTVSILPPDQVAAVLGPILPSTKLLVDSSGFVLDADGRSAGQDCGWSFEARFRALLAIGSSRLIRDF